MILGLDLGQTVGWVLGDAVGPLRSGSFELKNTTDLGAWLRSSDPLFQALLPQCTAIAVEQPFMGKSYFPARKLIALLGHVYYHWNCIGRSASGIEEIPVSTGKLTLSGHGGADKDRMIAAAAERGYPDLSEHEADALGIWWCYVFGRRESIAKARARTSKGVIIKP